MKVASSSKFKKKSRIEQMGEKIPSDIVFTSPSYMLVCFFYNPKVD